MKVGNHPLTGTLFFPTLGLALCGFVFSYWLSKRKQKSHHNGSAASITDTAPTEEETPVENGKPKVAKEKKGHKCGCGSNKSDIRPSTINIMYGTLTGKSKVSFATQILKQFTFIIVCIEI